MLIILPQHTAYNDAETQDEYTTLPTIDDIRYSELLTYEEEAVKITESYRKCFSWLKQQCQKRITLNKEALGTLHTNMMFFKQASLKTAMKELSIQHQLSLQSFDTIVTECAKASKAIGEPIAANEEREIMVKQSQPKGAESHEQHVIMESLVVKLSRRAAKQFKNKAIEMDFPVCIVKSVDKLHYSVYCLRKDREAVNRIIEDICPVEYSSQLNGTSFSGGSGTELSGFITSQMQEFYFLYLQALVVQGYLESLQRYGPPGLFRYAIIQCDENKKDKVIERIGNTYFDNSKDVSNDESDPCFTCLILDAV